MLIDRVHLVLLILKQHLLPVYCVTIKQAGIYYERPQTRLPRTAQGNIFMPWRYSIPNLLCMIIVIITDTLYINPAVKCIFRW